MVVFEFKFSKNMLGRKFMENQKNQENLQRFLYKLQMGSQKI